MEGKEAGAEQLGRAAPDSSNPLRPSQFWGRQKKEKMLRLLAKSFYL